MARMTSGEDFRLGTTFEDVRRILLKEEFADRLERPLGYWVLPSDRRLPLAFLNRSLRDLLSASFEDLSATPGIGQKKINSLVMLLHRATRNEPPAIALREGPATNATSPADHRSGQAHDGKKFNPAIVSEALWCEWCDVVRARNVGHEVIGRLAPSLQHVPTVIWHAPLGNYLDRTVAQIRSMRTHGEKRVRCVLEVFHSVYHLLKTTDETMDLDRRLTPPRMLAVGDWVAQQMGQPELPTAEAIRDGFAKPLIEQLEIDCGSTVHRLVTERLGLLGTTPRTVREQAKSLRVTRARVYQLLDDCHKVLTVRWPHGRALLDQLTGHFATLDGDPTVLRLFFALRELGFPIKQYDDHGPFGLAVSSGSRNDEFARREALIETNGQEPSDDDLDPLEVATPVLSHRAPQPNLRPTGNGEDGAATPGGVDNVMLDGVTELRLDPTRIHRPANGYPHLHAHDHHAVTKPTISTEPDVGPPDAGHA